MLCYASVYSTDLTAKALLGHLISASSISDWKHLGGLEIVYIRSGTHADAQLGLCGLVSWTVLCCSSLDTRHD